MKTERVFWPAMWKTVSRYISHLKTTKMFQNIRKWSTGAERSKWISRMNSFSLENCKRFSKDVLVLSSMFPLSSYPRHVQWCSYSIWWLGWPILYPRLLTCVQWKKVDFSDEEGYGKLLCKFNTVNKGSRNLNCCDYFLWHNMRHMPRNDVHQRNLGHSSVRKKQRVCQT